jgi:dihydrofolate reductase
MKPRLTLIAAMDEQRLIATSHGIPWHLPRDLAHFRAYTDHQWLLMGRRTYEQMRGWFKEGHMPLVLTRDAHWKPERGAAVATVEEAVKKAGEAGAPELVCCGGGQVYALAMPWADRMVLTLIEHRFSVDEGAVYFPKWEARDWEEKNQTRFPQDSENEYAMSLMILEGSPSRGAVTSRMA